MHFTGTLHTMTEKHMTQGNNSNKPERSPYQLHTMAMKIAGIFYQEQRKNNPAVEKYIADRELNEETLRKFGVGFAPDEWRKLSSHYSTRTMADAGHAAGILQKGAKGSNYDFFRGRLVFPVHNTQGDVAGFGGRAMPGMSSSQPREEGDAPPPKYLNSPESEFYHKGTLLYGYHQSRQNIRNDRLAVVVEGYIDVLRMHQEGMPNAVAPLGTAFTSDQMELLRKAGARTIAFCFDGDEAGQRAALGAAKTALEKADPWTEIRFVDLDGKDPDDFIRARGADAFAERLESSKEIADFLHDKFWPGDQSCLEDQAMYWKSMSEYISVAQGEQHRQLRERTAEALQLPVEQVMTNDSGDPVSMPKSEIISESERQVAQLLMHNKLPEYIVEQLETAFPQAAAQVASGKGDLAILANAMGPIQEDHIEIVLHNISQEASVNGLANAINELREMPFDEGLKDNVKKQLMISMG